MKFLPYEELTYESLLQKDEVIKRLATKIDPNPPFLNWKFGKLEQPFKGTIEGNKFMISKILSNSSKSLPYFFGEITESNEGSKVHIIIRPTNFRLAFSAVFYTGILCLGLLFIIITGESLWPGVLFPLGVILFSYTVVTISFKFQASFIKDDLMEILNINHRT